MAADVNHSPRVGAPQGFGRGHSLFHFFGGDVCWLKNFEWRLEVLIFASCIFFSKRRCSDFFWIRILFVESGCL